MCNNCLTFRRCSLWSTAAQTKVAVLACCCLLTWLRHGCQDALECREACDCEAVSCGHLTCTQPPQHGAVNPPKHSLAAEPAWWGLGTRLQQATLQVQGRW
jgi:hypothetical protein